MKANRFISTLFIEETENWFIQLFRYLFVGGFAFVVDYGLLLFLTEALGLHYLISATISFIAGLIVNYFLSTSWIFRKSRLENKWVEFLFYSIIGAIGLGLNNLLLYLLTDKVHIHYMISKLLATAFVMLWNFVSRRIILFTKK
jgi:putative flippase GtrA